MTITIKDADCRNDRGHRECYEVRAWADLADSPLQSADLLRDIFPDFEAAKQAIVRLLLGDR